MPNPAPAAKSKAEAPKAVARDMECLAVSRGRDGRYYTERVTIRGGVVVETKVVADNFGIEGLLLDGTIRFRQFVAETLNPLAVK